MLHFGVELWINCGTSVQMHRTGIWLLFYEGAACHEDMAFGCTFRYYDDT